MAKTYMSTIKYEVLANYEVQGVVDKPDIVGAIFGQSEGLLGQDMDLKELQQNGKIGRIEITVNKGKGTTSGQITIPSSLDQVKTSILAATMETVEKVGPFEAKVRVIKVTDTRKEKRETITDRAKELLKNMQQSEGIESDEMAQEVKEDLRVEDIAEYKGMPAGSEVETSDEIIIVEGRADVLKLLSYGIKNAIAMNGANITPELIELCKTKTVTVLADGDRGGELNIAKLGSLTKVDFIARAPDGKEVEELAQKEILLALKRKQAYTPGMQTHAPMHENGTAVFPQRQFNERRGFDNRNGGREGYSNYPRQNFHERPSFGNRPFNRDRNDRGGNFGGRPNNFSPRPFGDRRGFGGRDNYRQPFGDRNNFTPRPFNNNPRFTPQPQIIEQPVALPKEFEKMKKEFEKMKGKSKARLLDEKKKKIKDVDVKDLLTEVEKSKKKISTILFDGIVTNRLIETAEKKQITTLIGVKKGNIQPNEKVKIYTL